MSGRQSAMDSIGLIRAALNGDVDGTDSVIESLEPDELKRMAYALLSFCVLATVSLSTMGKFDANSFLDGMLAAGRSQ